MTDNFQPYRTLADDDAEIAKTQVETGLMSGFVGAKGSDFYGGKDVKRLEAMSSELFGYKHVISVNSWTSGLLLMLLAQGFDDPRDEVIVTPWTMSATALAIVQAGLTVVFADIDEGSFMPTADQVRAKVTDRTKAVLLADIFGQPYPFDELADLRAKGIRLLSDAAQAHLATRNGKPVGWDADMTGISLNRHKHINTGEGGLIFTENDDMAEFCRRARNHGENLPFEDGGFTNMIGYNFRLTETQAAIGVNQLRKLPDIVASRQELGKTANDVLAQSKFFSAVLPLASNSHSYYIYPILIQKPFRSAEFLNYLVEGMAKRHMPPLLKGYQNVHKLPIFSDPNATTGMFKRYYHSPKLHQAEHLHTEGFVGILFCNIAYTPDMVRDYLLVLEDVAQSY